MGAAWLYVTVNYISENVIAKKANIENSSSSESELLKTTTEHHSDLHQAKTVAQAIPMWVGKLAEKENTKKSNKDSVLSFLDLSEDEFNDYLFSKDLRDRISMYKVRTLTSKLVTCLLTENSVCEQMHKTYIPRADNPTNSPYFLALNRMLDVIDQVSDEDSSALKAFDSELLEKVLKLNNFSAPIVATRLLLKKANTPDKYNRIVRLNTKYLSGRPKLLNYDSFAQHKNFENIKSQHILAKNLAENIKSDLIFSKNVLNRLPRYGFRRENISTIAKSYCYLVEVQPSDIHLPDHKDLKYERRKVELVLERSGLMGSLADTCI